MRVAHSGTLFWLPPPPPLGPWGGSKRSNIIKFQLQSQFQRFLNQMFVCLLTNERYKTYHTGFSFGRLGHAPGARLGGIMGGWGVKKNVFRNSTSSPALHHSATAKYFMETRKCVLCHINIGECNISSGSALFS